MQHCNKWGQQYLDSQVQFKHPASATQNLNNNSSACRNTCTLTTFVNINNHLGETNIQRMAKSHQLEDALPESAGVAQSQTQRWSNKQRGSNKKKSYTVDFKKKTLDLLDSLKPTTNNNNTVTKQQGVNKSVVFISGKNTEAKFWQNWLWTRQRRTQVHKANETKEKDSWEKIPTQW